MSKSKTSITDRTSILGFSIIEMLVVISIFALIGVLATTSLSLTLKGSKKSDSVVKVRESLNYSLAVIERQLRDAESITTCDGTPAQSITYTTLDQITSSFSCVTSGSDKYVSSGSARLTSTDISITSCSFTCSRVDINNPFVIRLSISAEDAISTSTDKGTVTSDMEIVTRNY